MRLYRFRQIVTTRPDWCGTTHGAVILSRCSIWCLIGEISDLLYWRTEAGLYRLRKNPLPSRALEGRNLIAGGSAPGNGGYGSPTPQGSNTFGG
jgi:hypothetical protein